MPELKAITVIQPWAWAIAYAGKNIENRPWYTYQRGTIAIHAGAKWYDDPMPRGIRQPEDDEIVCSAIIAIADLVDCVDHARSKWFHGPYGWVIENVRPLKAPVPCKGALGFWKVPPAKVVAILDQLGPRQRKLIPVQKE
jgi:hypothetical protein